MNNNNETKYDMNSNYRNNWRKKEDNNYQEDNYNVNNYNYNYNNGNNKTNSYQNNTYDYGYEFKQKYNEGYSNNLTWKTRYNLNNCNQFVNNSYEYNSFLKDHLSSLKSKSISFGTDQLTLYDNNWNEIDMYLKENSFTELKDLNKALLNNLLAMEFKDLTPIQKAVYLPLKNANNLIGCSKTGSGKTVAFLLPIINKMLNSSPPLIENQEKSKIYIYS